MIRKEVILILLFFCFPGIFALSSLDFGINAHFKYYSADFYLQTHLNADSGFDGYDLNYPGTPDNYSLFYSRISDNDETGRLILDVWNPETESRRIINLEYFATDYDSDSLVLSWTPSQLGNSYFFRLQDFGTDSSYSSGNMISSINMNLQNSYSVTNSHQFRYFRIVTSYFYCGDNILNLSLGEQCEGTNLNGSSCASVSNIFNSGELGCYDTCLFDLSRCTTSYYCGDGIITPLLGEQCDGSNMNGQSCISQGFSSGDLSCIAPNKTNQCSFNTSSCILQNISDSVLNESGGGGGGAGVGCVNECSEKENSSVCLSSQVSQIRICKKQLSGCYKWGDFVNISCGDGEICYSGKCIPRDILSNPEKSCASLGYECGSYEIFGNKLNCGVCKNGFFCSNGRCLSNGEKAFQLSLFDRLMIALDWRNLLRLFK